MIQYHQQKTNEQGEFIVSHSDLGTLDPQMGGHPKMFYKSLTQPQVEKPSFEKGNMLHEWMQHKDSFVVSEQNKPTEQKAKLAEEFFRLYIKAEYINDPVIIAVISKGSTVIPMELAKYRELFTKIHLRTHQNDDEVSLFIACVRYARELIKYNANLKWETFLNDFEGIVPYINFMKENDGKVILTKDMKSTLVNAQESLREHPFASKLIFGMEGEAEKEYFWQKRIYVDGKNILLNRKAKLDKIIVDDINKIVIIPDLKTTHFPVADFVSLPFGAYHKYKLGRQLVNYADAFFQNNPDQKPEHWKIHLFNIVVQITDEYPVMVYKTEGMIQYELGGSLLDMEKRAAYHIKNNIWNLTMEEAINKDNEYIII